MSKKSFIPGKPILVPLPDENLVSYGDRMLWHQLGLQLNGHTTAMLTESEYVSLVCGFYPEALAHNVRTYRNDFNSRQDTMGFRDTEMPVPVQFVQESDKKSGLRRQNELLAEAKAYQFSASDRLSRDEGHERKAR
jgi:hypothetical protein